MVPIPATTRHCLVIHNPVAGQRHGGFLAATLDQLRAAGASVTVRDTTARGDAEAYAREASHGTWDLVVAAGGDGTINEVVNGLVGSAMPLAIVPLGTANVLASELGLPRQPEAVARAIAVGLARPVTLGRATSPLGTRHFILMAGIGFDAHVVRDVNTDLKRRFGKLAYVAEMVRQTRLFSFPAYEILVDGRAVTAASAVIANGRHYGGPWVITPRAGLGRESLALCLFRRRGLWNVTRYAVALALGLLPRLPDFEVIEGQKITIPGPAGEPVQGDGDLVAVLPVSLELAPERLLLVPGPFSDQA
jgi:YegS/Rv2252/BmrU family lipid kinase